MGFIGMFFEWYFWVGLLVCLGGTVILRYYFAVNR
jgi:hypothetical protein